MGRYDLTEFEWKAISRCFPTSRAAFLAWTIAGSGSPWADEVEVATGKSEADDFEAATLRAASGRRRDISHTSRAR